MMLCPFCNNTTFSKKIKKKYSIADKTFYYYICDECGSIMHHPVPSNEEIADYYENYIKIKKDMNPGYLSKNHTINFYNERHKTLREIGFNLGRFRDSTNVELGCANGQFLQFMKDNGATNIIGIDISKSMLDTIDMEGVSLICGDLSVLADKSVSNLFLFNILEHLPDIEMNMHHITRIMKDGGQLIIEVPLAGLISKHFGGNWRFLMPVEHLNVPSIEGLKILLARNNIDIIGKTRFGSGFTTGDASPFVKKIMDTLSKKFAFGDRGAFLCSLL